MKDFQDRIGVGKAEGKSFKVLIEYDQKTGVNLPDGVKVLRTYRLLPLILAEVSSSDLKEASRARGILGVYPDSEIYLCDAKTKFKVGETYPHLGTYPAFLNDTVKLIGANSLWDKGFRGEGVKVAVIDTGINKKHPNLYDPKVVEEISFVDGEGTEDYQGHGTLVAGIIAGTGEAGGKGFYGWLDEKVMNTSIKPGTQVGVAPKAKLLNAKVFNLSGVATVSSIIAGIEWAVEHGADVINMSFGGYPMAPKDQLVKAVEKAVAKGVVVVVSAGNWGPGRFTVMSPGRSPSAVTVGSVYRTGEVVYFSSRGPAPYGMILKPDLVAPGATVISAYQNKTLKDVYYAEFWGSSAATAFVSGASALLVQAFSKRTPYMIKAGLVRGASDLKVDPNVGGGGLLNVLGAYQYLSSDSSKTMFTLKEINSMTGPHITLFPGDFNVLNLTVLNWGASFNGSLKISGNASEIVSFSNASSLAMHDKFKIEGQEIWDPTPRLFTYGQKYCDGAERKLEKIVGQRFVALQILVPDKAKLGTYTGSVTLLRENSAVAELPVNIVVKKPKAKILFDDVFQGYYDPSSRTVFPIDAERLWGGSLFSLAANIWPLGVFDWWRLVSEAGYDVDSLGQVLNATGVGDPWALFMSGKYNVIYLHDTELHNMQTSMFPKLLKIGVNIVALYDGGFDYSLLVKPLYPEGEPLPPISGLIQNFNGTHPIAQGVKNATYISGVGLAVLDPAQVVATAYDVRYPALSGVAVATYDVPGGGKFVALGDSNIFDDIGLAADYTWLVYYVSYGMQVKKTENDKLALNILNYASAEVYKPIEPIKPIEPFWAQPIFLKHLLAVCLILLAVTVVSTLIYRRRFLSLKRSIST